VAEAGSGAQRGLLVVMPTYNERDNITSIVERVLAANPQADLLVVDDGSPDGTGALADELAAADGRVQVMHRRTKAGLGAAYIAGFRWALDRGYDTVVEMDADGSHAPEELPRLLTALDDADVVMGSRWISGGQVRNWPARRMVLSRGGNAYTRLALGIGLHDVTGGYRAFRSCVLHKLDLDEVASQGYCFQVDIAWRAVQAGWRVVEVPITFTEREHGTSKMSQSIVREALGRVTVWGAQHRIRQLRGFLARARSQAAQRP
jgi:dolichol-phosphate mannosyltransferase